MYVHFTVTYIIYTTQCTVYSVHYRWLSVVTAVEQAEGLQEADRGGRGDSRLEPGKVQENSGNIEG